MKITATYVPVTPVKPALFKRQPLTFTFTTKRSFVVTGEKSKYGSGYTLYAGRNVVFNEQYLTKEELKELSILFLELSEY